MGSSARWTCLLVLLAMATGCKDGQNRRINRTISLPELYWEETSRCRAEQRETGKDCEGREQQAREEK